MYFSRWQETSYLYSYKSISKQRKSICTKVKVPREGQESGGGNNSHHQLTIYMEEADQHLQRADVQVTGSLYFRSKVKQLKLSLIFIIVYFTKEG